MFSLSFFSLFFFSGSLFFLFYVYIFSTSLFFFLFTLFCFFYISLFFFSLLFTALRYIQHESLFCSLNNITANNTKNRYMGKNGAPWNFRNSISQRILLPKTVVIFLFQIVDQNWFLPQVAISFNSYTSKFPWLASSTLGFSNSWPLSELRSVQTEIFFPIANLVRSLSLQPETVPNVWSRLNTTDRDSGISSHTTTWRIISDHHLRSVVTTESVHYPSIRFNKDTQVGIPQVAPSRGCRQFDVTLLEGSRDSPTDFFQATANQNRLLIFPGLIHDSLLRCSTTTKVPRVLFRFFLRLIRLSR